MPSLKISQFTVLPAVTPDTEVPVIDPINPAANYRVKSGVLIGWNQPDGIYQLSGGEPYVDDTIYSPSPGELAAEFLTAAQEASGGLVRALNLTDGPLVVSDSGHALRDASGISTPGDGSLDVADEVRCDALSVATGLALVDDVGNLSCQGLSVAGSFSPAAIATPLLTLTGLTSAPFLATNAAGLISGTPYVSISPTGEFSAPSASFGGLVGASSVSAGSVAATLVIGQDASFSGTISADVVDSPNITSSSFGMSKAAVTSSTAQLGTDPDVTVAIGGNWTFSGEVKSNSLDVASGLATISAAGVIDAVELKAGNGFSGTGIYTTFTFLNGICTAAS